MKRSAFTILRKKAASQLAAATVSDEFKQRIDHRKPDKQAWPLSEHELQKNVIENCRMMHGAFPKLGLLYAIPNGGSRSVTEARRLIAEGVRPGVPDLCLPVARGRRHALYLELKKAKGVPSADQWLALQDLDKAGNAVAVVNDLKTAISILTRYLNGESISAQ